MKQTLDEWRGHVEKHLQMSTDRAKIYSRWLFKLIPVSALIGLLAILLVWQIYGVKELGRMLLQVVLTLTVGATLLAGFIRKLEKKVQE